MSIEITVAFIAALAALAGTLVGTWTNIQSQKSNAQLQTSLTEKQLKNSFQLAAMEKRLEAHQKAYAIWTKMASYVHSSYDVKDRVRNEAVEFFSTHCLYLEPKAAEEFKRCINNYYDYKTQLDIVKMVDRNSPDANNALKSLEKMWDQIQVTGKYIMEGAKYPFINIDPTKEDLMGEKKEENNSSR